MFEIARFQVIAYLLCIFATFFESFCISHLTMCYHGRTIRMLQGEVQILTGGIVREHAQRADKVQFLDRRYSPDERSDYCVLQYVCALEGAFFICTIF